MLTVVALIETVIALKALERGIEKMDKAGMLHLMLLLSLLLASVLATGQ